MYVLRTRCTYHLHVLHQHPLTTTWIVAARTYVQTCTLRRGTVVQAHRTEYSSSGGSTSLPHVVGKQASTYRTEEQEASSGDEDRRSTDRGGWTCFRRLGSVYMPGTGRNGRRGCGRARRGHVMESRSWWACLVQHVTYEALLYNVAVLPAWGTVPVRVRKLHKFRGRDLRQKSCFERDAGSSLLRPLIIVSRL